MEMNPFTLDAEGKPFPLDMRGELDDTAYFKSGKKWGDVEFPLPFGRTMSAAEVRLQSWAFLSLTCDNLEHRGFPLLTCDSLERGGFPFLACDNLEHWGLSLPTCDNFEH